MDASSSSCSSYAKGDMVAVRCNQHKWLLGEVKRASSSPRGGVRVWVADAALLVNVPRQLVPSHLLKMSSVDEALHSLPPARSMLSTATRIPSDHEDRLLVSCVRPAHLSHRLLYLPAEAAATAASDCAICGQALVEEDEAVAPWDCCHNCHIDCIQDRPHFFTTTTCPLCSTTRSPSPSPSHSPSPSPLPSPSPSPSNSRKLQTIDELHTPSSSSSSSSSHLKPGRKQSVSFQDAGKHTNAAAAAQDGKQNGASNAPSPSRSSLSVPSLAERMKKFSISAASAACDAATSTNQASGQQWLTVIRDGQDTRETDVSLEHMAKAKENTFSAKAKQQS